MKLGKYNLSRRGIRWLVVSKSEENGLTFAYRQWPREPKLYGRVVEIEPDAVTEEPQKVVFDAMLRLTRDAIETDVALRKRGRFFRRGLDLRTLQFYFVPPDADNANLAIGWKARSS